MIPIENKHIVLTGANSGIGLEVLKLLLERKGNIIFAVDLNTDIISTFDPSRVIPYVCDVSKPQNIDCLFENAVSAMGSIDIFYANAGFAYYEQLNYIDWKRIENIFETNTVSPIYSYQKFVEYLNGREGMFAITGSAMGFMGMPGFTLYSASKFAITGFQESVRLEKPDNIHLITLFPVSTDTGFFKTASNVEFKKPYPVQSPDIVARKMIKGMEKRKKKVMPCTMFRFALVLFRILPFVRTMYWNHEKKKFEDYKSKRDNLTR